MRTISIRYADGVVPCPGGVISVMNTENGVRVERLQAVIDSGADQTVLPASVINTLEVEPDGEEEVLTYDNRPGLLNTFTVELTFFDFAPFELRVFASEFVDRAVIGRDVLNQFKVVLDGPRLRLEVTGE